MAKSKTPTKNKPNMLGMSGLLPLDKIKKLSDKALIDQINNANVGFENLQRQALPHALKAGFALNEMKRRITERQGRTRGEWGPWLRKHFKGKTSTAQNYMKLASNFNLIEDGIKDGTITTYTEALEAVVSTKMKTPIDDTPPQEALPLRFVFPRYVTLKVTGDTDEVGVESDVSSWSECFSVLSEKYDTTDLSQIVLRALQEASANG